jgi:hypothetical protein
MYKIGVKWSWENIALTPEYRVKEQAVMSVAMSPFALLASDDDVLKSWQARAGILANRELA